VDLVKSKKRVADHGEVFTPSWMVEAMTNLVKEESNRIDSRFLEPACGSGNFLVSILKAKLATVETKYSKSEFEKQHYALLSLMCIYGIEILSDNISECRCILLETFSKYLNINKTSEIYKAGAFVLKENIVHGDALTMLGKNKLPIIFSEWGYLGGGRYQRRVFRFESLTASSAFSAQDSLFANLGKHEIFTPTETFPPCSAKELANLFEDKNQ